MASPISARFYPHIIDQVLGFLCDDDPLAASNLQTVCRDWQTKIRAHLFTHIWVAFDKECGWSPTGLSLTIGTIRPHPAPSLQFTIQAPDPYRSKTERGTKPIEHPAVLATMHTARAVDIWSPHWKFRLPTADWTGGKLQMVRLGINCCQNDPEIPPSETLVIFKDPRPEEMGRTEGSDLYGRAVECSLARQIIYHPDELDFGLLDFTYFDLPETVKNLTVFYPFPPNSLRRKRAEACNEYLMETLVANITQLTNDGRTITFVSPDANTDTDRYSAVRNPEEPSWAYIKSLLIRRDDAARLLAHVEFQTTAEYRERVGEDTFQLHAYMEGQELPKWGGGYYDSYYGGVSDSESD